MKIAKDLLITIIILVIIIIITLVIYYITVNYNKKKISIERFGNNSYTYKGCYGETINNWDNSINDWGGRIMNNRLSTQINSVDECYNLAKQNNYNTFGLQNGNQCYAGNDIIVDSYTPLSNCPVLGGSLQEQIYTINNQSTITPSTTTGTPSTTTGTPSTTTGTPFTTVGTPFTTVGTPSTTTSTPSTTVGTPFTTAGTPFTTAGTPSATTGTPSTTTIRTMTTIPLIANSVKNGYNKMNDSRFETIDNQIRLDNLGARINKLLDNIQNTYSMVSNQSLKMPMTFY